MITEGNCDLILPQMVREGQKFDLILTDPPYNIGKDFGNDSDSLSLSDFLDVSRRRIELCKELLSDNGSLIWFGSHRYIGYLQVLMYEVGLYYRRMNIWKYSNGMSRFIKSPVSEYEPFLWFSRSDKSWIYNLDDVRVPYRSTQRLRTPVWKKNAKGEKVKWTPNPQGARRGDVWEYPVLSGKRFAHEKTPHPTQKPCALFMDILKAFCPKDEDRYVGHVLDPFLGSGTTAVACEMLNHNGHSIAWEGVELEHRWAEVARQRIRDIG